MKKTALNRRTFLKGMLAGAAVSIGLPPLEAFMNTNGTAYASGDGFPKRFGLFYWGNGVHPELWIPSDTGTNWTPSQQLTPFANLQSFADAEPCICPSTYIHRQPGLPYRSH